MTTAYWRRDDVDLPGLDRLAQRIALFIVAGDCIALSGPLGAGKTTFARFLIAALGGAEEVQSPTFGLLQSYPTPRLMLHHCDFYRLEPGETQELGLEDCLDDGALMIEWPERAAPLLCPDRLDIAFADTAAEDRRALTLTAHGDWTGRLERLKLLDGFLAGSAYGDCTVRYMQGDASARAYARLSGPGPSAVLMNAPRMADGPPIRGGKPYSQLVHLAEDVQPFVAVGGALRARGLSAPEIRSADLERGFLILEDLGDKVFAGEIAAGAPQEALTRAAVEVLLHLAKAPPESDLPVEAGANYSLPDFDAEAMLIEASLVVDWLWPAVHGREAPEAVRRGFLAAWTTPLEDAAKADPGWVLRDYHSPNLMWLPERRGFARVGLLDFQDAMRGPLAYDLVSLLQDARVDVPAALEAKLLDHYCASRHAADPAFSADSFRRRYALLGAQRNSKILGIFARLAKRDGKRGYLAHMPRVARYLQRDLAHPGLEALRAWYEAELPPASELPPAAL
jgi:N-acetylmuramate 1-kinase